jgi:recombination endonuclease VII
MKTVHYHKGIPEFCRKGHALSEDNRYFKATGQVCCLACDRTRYENQKSKILDQQRQYRQNNLEHCRELGRKRGRKYRLQEYNLTEKRYDEMYAAQKGLCILPSCGRPIEVIDHCHKTLQTRGLMCDRHNVALGLFSDNPQLLREAAVYLEKFYEL